MRKPTETKFCDLPIGHYFTSGWVVHRKTGDRVAIQTSGMFDGAGTYHHFAPDKIVYSWGNRYPTHKEREEFFMHEELLHTLMMGYRVNLVRTSKYTHPHVTGNYHTPGGIGHA